MKHSNKQLDGLRGVAILWVVAYHLLACAGMHPSLTGLLIIPGVLQLGWIGVMIFFALSGYLITHNLVAAKSESRYFLTFICKRVARILPIYLLLLASLPIAATFWAPERSEAIFNRGIPIWSHFVFIQNIYMALSGYFGNGWLRVTWSLAVEVQYYCFIVVVVWIVPKHRMPFVLSLIAVSSVVMRCLIYRAGFNQTALITLAPCRMDSFALGGLVALYRGDVKSELYLLCATGIGSLGAMLFLAFANGWFEQYTPLLVPLYYSFLALACAATVAIGVAGRRVFGFLEIRGLVNIGRTSYFLYLFHMPVALIFYQVFTKNAPEGSTLVGVSIALISFLFCWALANVSFIYFENPIISYVRNKLKRPDPELQPTPVSGAADL